MAFAPKQSKANQIWLATFVLVILALAIETQPHEKRAQKISQEATSPKSVQRHVGIDR